MIKPRSSLIHDRGVRLARRLAKLVLRRHEDDRGERPAMEDQELVRRALFGVLRECGRTKEQGREAAPAGSQVVVFGNMSVTINGGLHLAMPGAHLVNCNDKAEPG